MANNLFDQAPYALRGENDARIAALEAKLATVTLEEWTGWTPVVAQGVTPTQAIVYATCHRVGRLYTCHFALTFSTGGTANNNIVLSGWPVAAANSNGIRGMFRYFDAGNTNRAGTILGATTTTANFYYDGYGNAMGNGDFAIANTDAVQGTVIVEAAS